MGREEGSLKGVYITDALPRKSSALRTIKSYNIEFTIFLEKEENVNVVQV